MTDRITLLLEFPFRDDAALQLAKTLNVLISELPLVAPAVTAWQSISAAVATCYIEGELPSDLQEVMHCIATLAQTRLAAIRTGNIELSRLRNVALHTGAAAGASAGFHYVVRTDVEAGGDDELQRWYDEEHMAMLAAVPGTVRARRLVSLDAKPQYYACYDLVAPEVLTSAEWLKVRQSPWSQRVRPTFRNTRRVISRAIDLAAAGNPAQCG